MLLCVPCHSKNLEEKSLTDIANAFKAPWIGWQELSIAGLPLLPEESEAILSKLSDQSFAQTSVAAILEKNGKINEAIAALEKIEPGDQFRTKHVWRSRLYHTIDNEQLALKSLQMADQAFHTHKTPYGTQQIFINQTRMAFAMDQLDSLRSWLEWIIESNCSATLRWQAMQEILAFELQLNTIIKRQLTYSCKDVKHGGKIFHGMKGDCFAKTFAISLNSPRR